MHVLATSPLNGFSNSSSDLPPSSIHRFVFKPRNAAILMVRDAFTVSTDEKFSWLSFPIFPDDNTLFKTFFYL